MTYTLTTKRLAAYGAAGAAVMGTAGVAQADFTGYYDHANWTFATTNAQSDASVTGATPTFLEITGHNNANGGDVATYTIAAAASGTVSFNWNYTSTDTGNYDNAGFYLNGALMQLVNNDTQGAGVFSTNVNAGDIFGFFVRSADGILGPGVFQITSFSAPTGVIPEPGIAAILALGTVGGTLAMRRRRVVKN